MRQVALLLCSRMYGCIVDSVIAFSPLLPYYLFLCYCGCKSKHKNDTNKQFIKKMQDKTAFLLFYPAKRNKKILFILF